MATGIIGYFASTMVLLTFITKDMRRLRVIAILSNVAFIGYGMLGWLPPVLCLHLLLLPLNIARLMQLQRTANDSDRSGLASFRGVPLPLLNAGGGCR
jgi:hypothetical protein